MILIHLLNLIFDLLIYFFKIDNSFNEDGYFFDLTEEGGKGNCVSCVKPGTNSTNIIHNRINLTSINNSSAYSIANLRFSKGTERAVSKQILISFSFKDFNKGSNNLI